MEHFGKAALIVVREKASKKWHEIEATTVRNDVRG